MLSSLWVQPQDMLQSTNYLQEDNLLELLHRESSLFLIIPCLYFDSSGGHMVSSGGAKVFSLHTVDVCVSSRVL